MDIVSTMKQINNESGHICWGGVQQEMILEKNAKEERKTVTDSWLKSVGEKGTVSCNVDVDECDKFVMRNTVWDSYMEERKVPTVPEVLSPIKEK
jgi:hypothetical protein